MIREHALHRRLTGLQTMQCHWSERREQPRQEPCRRARQKVAQTATLQASRREFVYASAGGAANQERSQVPLPAVS